MVMVFSRDPRSIMLNGLGGALSGMDEDERKRFRNSEVAKQRYHRLSEDQKREVRLFTLTVSCVRVSIWVILYKHILGECTTFGPDEEAQTG